MKKEKSRCCPVFEPKRWQNKKHIWKNKLFLKDKVFQVFHIPLNMGSVISRMWQLIQSYQADPDPQDVLMLAYDPSPWVSELYISVTHKIPGAQIVKMSGTFISRVYDGPYNAVPQWIQQQEEYVRAVGYPVGKHYFYYTTCPKCAKAYGHNYVVAFTQVA